MMPFCCVLNAGVMRTLRAREPECGGLINPSAAQSRAGYCIRPPIASAPIVVRLLRSTIIGTTESGLPWNLYAFHATRSADQRSVP